MRRRTTIITTSALAVAAAGTALGLWIAQPSYDDTVRECRKDLVEQQELGVRGKPDSCKDVKADDYTAIAADVAIDGLGWTDEDGKFDEDKMLDDVTQP